MLKGLMSRFDSSSVPYMANDNASATGLEKWSEKDRVAAGNAFWEEVVDLARLAEIEDPRTVGRTRMNDE